EAIADLQILGRVPAPDPAPLKVGVKLRDEDLVLGGIADEAGTESTVACERVRKGDGAIGDPAALQESSRDPPFRGVESVDVDEGTAAMDDVRQAQRRAQVLGGEEGAPQPGAREPGPLQAGPEEVRPFQVASAEVRVV